MIRPAPALALALALALVPASAAAQDAPALDPPAGLETHAPANDEGTHIALSFRGSLSPAVTHYEIWRAPAGPQTTIPQDPPDVDDPKQGWTLVKRLPDDDQLRASYTDNVPSSKAWIYAVRAVAAPPNSKLDGDAPLPAGARTSHFVKIGPERPVSDWFDENRGFILFMIFVMLGLLVYFYDRAKRAPKKMYIRRIPGIDAMEEAVGRATEMGRPVLYIAGIDEIQNIQTVAGLLILGSVAEMVARYDTQIRVPCTYPINMVIAEEIVRQGFYNAGRPDAHRPQNIQFISSEQFAFCAGVAGIITREKPATNIYLGRFFAESLILAEAGHVNKSIQIGGTAEITQLPFFIAACDYAVIGEELFAVSAYLSRDPKQLSMLKATDFFKIGLIFLILLGVVLNTFGVLDLAGLLNL